MFFTNLYLWLRRAEYSKRWHIFHYTLTVMASYLAFPAISCDLAPKPFVVYVQSMSIIISSGLLARKAALTQLHLVLSVSPGLIYQFILILNVSSEKLGANDIFIVVNFVISPILLATMFWKCSQSKNTHPYNFESRLDS